MAEWKATTMFLEPGLHRRLRTAAAFRQTTLRRVVNDLVKGFVINTEADMREELDDLEDLEEIKIKKKER